MLQTKSSSDQDVYHGKLLLLNLARFFFFLGGGGGGVRYLGFLETALPVDTEVYGLVASPHPGQRI